MCILQFDYYTISWFQDIMRYCPIYFYMHINDMEHSILKYTPYGLEIHHTYITIDFNINGMSPSVFHTPIFRNNCNARAAFLTILKTVCFYYW